MFALVINNDLFLFKNHFLSQSAFNFSIFFDQENDNENCWNHQILLNLRDDEVKETDRLDKKVFTVLFLHTLEDSSTISSELQRITAFVLEIY